MKSADQKKITFYRVCCNYLFPVFLLLYPLRHINWGLDLGDIGYNYSNFQYMGTEHMDSMWLFSTYLANAAGNLLMKLPFAGSLLGMNFYTSFFVGALALTGYFFCSRVLHIPAPAVFVGELTSVSLCWCPTALLYNYLTYVFFLAGVILLYLGLTREKKEYLLLAGAALGTNVFVRFSNLPEAALILAVWAYGIICRKKSRKVAAETGWCMLGYFAAAAVWLGYLSIRYGFWEYVSGIRRLFAMTDTATDYTPKSMLMGTVLPYLQNLYWVKWLLILVAVGMMGFMVLPGRFVKWKKAVFAGMTLCAVGWLYVRKFCSLDFTVYDAMLRPGILFLLLSLFVCAALILSKVVEKERKLTAGLMILIIFLTSLGSNNNIFPSLNNLFLVAPFVLWQLFLFCRSATERILPGKLRVRISLYPAKTMLLAFLAVFLFQSVGFGTGFTFVEGTGAKNIDTKVENNAILKGIWMSGERAEWMTGLSDYISENGLCGRELLPYGQIPSLCYYLQMPPAFNSWSDLASYSLETMEADLEKLAAKMSLGGPGPVIIVENTYMVLERDGAAGLEAMGLAAHRIEQISEDAKWERIRRFMADYGYRQDFANDKFAVFIMEEE